MSFLLAMCLLLTTSHAEPPSEAPADPLPPIPANRTWDVLTPAEDPRDMLWEAGERLGPWRIDVAGVPLDGWDVAKLARTAPDEPIVRVVREALRRPFDLTDLLYFLDDVIAAGEAGRRGEAFFVGAGRARSAGILVHPDDVFKSKPRVYPRRKTLSVDEPLPQETFPPAEDGAPPGPEWTMRFRNPTEREEMYRTLAEKRPRSGFASRIAALVWQLEQQGAEVYLTSFLRWPERGYLMWGAAELRKCTDAGCVGAAVAKLDDRNTAWKLGVPITWAHPDGWEATAEAGRRMADAYDVVYATENGARYSNHYDGVAADFVAIGLPRELTLLAPDGAQRTFDLSAADETRDLSLSPELIAWIEEHFRFRKLNSDYPHWNDADG